MPSEEVRQVQRGVPEPRSGLEPGRELAEVHRDCLPQSSPLQLPVSPLSFRGPFPSGRSSAAVNGRALCSFLKVPRSVASFSCLRPVLCKGFFEGCCSRVVVVFWVFSAFSFAVVRTAGASALGATLSFDFQPYSDNFQPQFWCSSACRFVFCLNVSCFCRCWRLFCGFAPTRTTKV